MIWIDYVIVVVIIISAFVSLLRGFLREALSLVGWIVAFWVALTFCEPVAEMLKDQIPVPSLRIGAAFFALFIGVLLVTGLITYLVGLLLEKTGVSGTDRVLGMVFGAARGVFIVALLVMAAGWSPLPFPKDPWWKSSLLIPHFENVVVQLKSFLPPDLAKEIEF